MFFKRIFIVLMTCLPLTSVSLAAEAQPVTPNASPEAKALLQLMYNISGKYTLMGQHNYPNTRDRNSQFAAQYIGELPPIWSTDMGFAEDGDTDSYLARPDIVEEAIRQHKMGSLVTICWHAVPPTADEPVTFSPRRDGDPAKLETVQGQLLDEQFKDVLTPGTALYNKWASQVDSVAFYLKKLQKARVPILWRPYHEMNGDWFWWGGRIEDPSTVSLYRQIFDRLVNYHKIDNLVWLWSVDRAHQEKMHYSYYYPGNDYLDIVSLDVYGSDFSEAYYDSLKALSKGKPMVLGEVGNPPSLEILEQQPLWAFWVVWAGMVRNTTKTQYQEFLASPRVLSYDDPVYWEITTKYRKACGLELLPVKLGPTDFSGLWMFNEEKSQLGSFGAGNTPYKMEVNHTHEKLISTRFSIVEWGDDRVIADTLKLDGSEMKSTFWNSPRITNATWSDNGDTLIVASTTIFTRGGQTTEINSTEKWSLRKRGTELVIEQKSMTFRGESVSTVIYEKK